METVPFIKSRWTSEISTLLPQTNEPAERKLLASRPQRKTPTSRLPSLSEFALTTPTLPDENAPEEIMDPIKAF